MIALTAGALGTVFLASAFGTFALFLFFGLLALPITAALDKSLGKEKGLLLYAVALLAFTFFVLRPDGPATTSVRVGKENLVPAEKLVQQGDPFARAEPNHEAERNAFEPYSDTRDLPPVTLETPPWIPIAFELPPTVPGPAPGHRRVLRGTMPKLTKGDGTSIAEFPDALFADYTPHPKDVYDWVMSGSKPVYIYLLAIHDGDAWAREGEPKFEELKWLLAENAAGVEKMKVKIAFVGDEEKAKTQLGRLDVLKARRSGVSTKDVKGDQPLFLRRTVANLYAEALMRTLGRRSLPTGKIDPDKLRRAAQEMAEVGKTGKESRAGWRKAVELLNMALETVRAERGLPERAEVLLELLEAQRALRDEQAVLRTLSEYLATAPNSAEARTWLGTLHLQSMQLPREALLYYDDALSRNRGFSDALIGRGDALTYVGQHEEASRAYARASGDEAKLRRAATELRLGQLDRARGSAESLLAQDPGNQHAVLIRACALYALGDLDTARSAFEQVASSPDGQELRAQACYNLGLTCARLGQHDAAQAAFDACEKALRQGSRTGPTPDEVVSPSLGRAFLAYGAGDDSALSAALDAARDEAPRSSYLEMFRGMVASRENDDAVAIRALDAALNRAPEYGELDAWLGLTYLRLGASAVATGASPRDSAETFERAVAFSERGADREARVDKDAWKQRLRECLVRLGAQHLPAKERYTLALGAAQKVLDNPKHRENAPALALSAFCHFQLGLYDEDSYDECIRRFQDVLRIVPMDEADPDAGWRAYSESALKAVKKWRSLEEKLVTFTSPTLSRDMLREEAKGVRAVVEVEQGALNFKGQSSKDGTPDDPTVGVWTTSLFTKNSFESVTMRLRIPRTDVNGRTTNNISFGVRVIGKKLRKGSKGGKAPGIGIFYDRNKIALRIGGGQIKQYKDGEQLRMDPEKEWPENEEVVLRIERVDEDTGEIAVYLDDELIVKDRISAFKQGRGDATLWIGGSADEAQPFDVWVSDIRVIRKKDGK